MRIDIRVVSNKIHANKFCNLKQLHVKFHKFHGLTNPFVKKEKPRSDNENPLFIYFLINENFFYSFAFNLQRKRAYSAMHSTAICCEKLDI